MPCCSAGGVCGGRETIREGMLGGEECGLQCPRPLDNVLRTLLPPDDPPAPTPIDRGEAVVPQAGNQNAR